MGLEGKAEVPEPISPQRERYSITAFRRTCERVTQCWTQRYANR